MRRSSIKRGAIAALFATAVALLGPCGDGWSQPRAQRPDLVSEFLGRGDAAFRRGDFAAATQAWREAARLCRVQGRLGEEGEMLARSAEANLALGFFDVAIAELGQALAAAEAAGDDRLVAAVAGALGNAQLFARRYAAAERSIERSIALAQRTGERQVLAASLNNLGNLLAATRQWTDALDAYRDSAEIARELGSDLLVVALRNAARIHLRRDHYALAMAALGEAAQWARRMAPSPAKVQALVSIATLATSEAPGPLTALAYDALAQAVAAAEATRDLRGQSIAFGYLGTLYETGGRHDEARLLTDRALDLAQRENAPELAYRWEWQSARLLKAAGDESAALDAYLRAVRVLQEVRRDIPIEYEEGRSSFRETLGPLYLQLADLLLRRARGAADAAALSLTLSQVRETVETIKAAELQDYFKDQCVATARRAVKVEAVAPRTAVIYPIILPDRLELLVSLAGGDAFATVPVTEDDLVDEVGQLRVALEDADAPRDEVGKAAQRVYDRVIRPVAGLLQRNDVATLVIVPDGVLRTVPLAALHDGRRYMVESFALATAPGLTLVDPEPLPRHGMMALVAGISEGVQGFPPLPAAAIEVDRVARSLGGATSGGAAGDATMLLDRTFSMQGFAEQMTTKPYHVVHIASHGVFDSTAEDSFVLAYDAKITMNRLEEIMKFERREAQPVELLTLSACSTAAGDDRTPLGLAGIALKSGARSSLATLWPVSDEATTELTGLVYAAIARGEATKAEALQQAQIALIRSPRFAHPAFWAPFLLIGNWL